MNNKEIKNSTENYIDVVLKQAEEKSGLVLVEVLVESISFIDPLVNSLLLVSGASLTLGIVNAKTLVPILGNGNFKLFIVLMLVSAILGFGARTCHAISSMYLSISKELNSRIEQILDKFDAFETELIEESKKYAKIESRTFDVERVYSTFAKAMPSFLQEFILKAIAESTGDSATPLRSASTAAFLHLIFFCAQTVLIAMAFLLSVFGLE